MKKVKKVKRRRKPRQRRMTAAETELLFDQMRATIAAIDAQNEMLRRGNR